MLIFFESRSPDRNLYGNVFYCLFGYYKCTFDERPQIHPNTDDYY